mgnify:CR=1 FL=1
MLAIRPLAITFGIAGLVPLIAALLVILFWQTMEMTAMRLFYLYSAGIIAFLAGVYWPVSLQLEHRSYPLSPLIAMGLSQAYFVSAGLALLTPWTLQALIFPILFILMCVTDWLAMSGYWPQWYLIMRLALTSAVVACQAVAGIWLFLL